MTSTWIVDGVRTPFGRHGGALAHVRPDDLAAGVISGLVARRPELDPATIDDVVLGNANGAGEENRNVGRMAGLLAGLPTSVPGGTVNRLCGSGMEAVILASRAIESGDADTCIAGGVESMSRAPWVVLKPERGFARGDTTMHSTTLGWRLVNPRMPPQHTIGLGAGAERLARRYGIDRLAQDEFALGSHERAEAAWNAGRFDDEVVDVDGSSLDRDESIRADTDLAALATLPPAFDPDGTVTAGNASPLNDGAAALLLASEPAARSMEGQPLARIASRAVAAVDPADYGVGPVPATRLAMKRAGIDWKDVVAVELNEAFAAQALACLAEWPDVDPAIVNPNGGAIALGHPIGCSGARLVLTLARELARRGGGFGVAAMCIGVGQGLAVVLEHRSLT